MDLTTTLKIKRRVINIVPDPVADTTNCSVTVANWTQNINVDQHKTRISSFYLNNSAIPCFVGKWMSALPPADFQTNLLATPGTVTTDNYALTNNSLDYYFNFYNTSNDDCFGGIINMNALRSTYPDLIPPSHPTSEFAQLSNKYYWFFNTSLFLDLIIDQINTVINAHAISTTIADYLGIQLIRTPDGYGLYVPTTITDSPYILQFSKSLIDLFQFKASLSSNSTYLYDIELNPTQRTFTVADMSHGGYVSTTCLFVASNYVPDRWFPFDQLLVRTTLPIESETFFNNSNYISQNFQNIMLTYKLSNNNPDGIYNYYTSEIDPHSGWCSYINSNSSDNVNFEFLLRLTRTGDLLPYQIKYDETCYFVIESIITE